jgi:hypothetical protein
MGDTAYALTRFGYLRDEITDERARELFAQAQAREGSELVGDLGSEFAFFARVTLEGVPLVRCRVERL